MRWMRDDWFAVGIYAAFAAIACSLTLSRDTSWHFEIARATDAAGVHLFFSGPLLAALVAIAAQRRTRYLAGFAEAIPGAALGPRSVWPRYAACAIVVQSLLIAVAAVLAWRHDAIGVWSLQPFVRQHLLIAAMCAAGALLGSVARSLLVPGLAVASLVGVALLVPRTGLQSFLLAGVNTFDFTFDRYQTSLLLVGLLIAGGFVMLAWPRRVARRAQRHMLIVANGFLAAGAVLSVSGDPYLVADADRVRECIEQEPRVCSPTVMTTQALEVIEVFNTVYAVVPRAARSKLPGEFHVNSDLKESANTITYTSDMAGNDTALNATVQRTLSGALACDEPRDDEAEFDHALGAAVVEGWLQHESGTVVDGSFPRDEVDRLRSMNRTTQETIVASLMDQIWTCRDIDLSPLE